MQPLQYYLRDPAAKDNSITHAAAARSNLDAAITLRSAETELELRVTASEIAAPKPDLDAKATKRRFWSTSWKKIEKEKLLLPKLTKSADKSLSQPWCSHSNTIYNAQLQKTIVNACSRGTKQPWRSHHNAFCSMTWLTRMHRRTWQHQMTTIVQPFQCDLQPQIQETHRTTHTGKTTHCRTQRRNRLTSKRSKTQPPHTRGTFHRRLQPLYTEINTRFLAPASSPKQSPCNIHAAITMRFAAWRGYPATPHASTHMATPDDNNHAAIPMRSATTESRNA